MFCGKCGQSISNPRIQFCPRCGSPINQAAAQHQQQRMSAGSAAGNRNDWRMRAQQGNYSLTMPVQMGGGAKPSHTRRPATGDGLTITAMCGDSAIDERDVSLRQPGTLTFGAEDGCSIRVAGKDSGLPAMIGRIIVQNGLCVVQESGPSAPLFLNGIRQNAFTVAPGDVVTVGGGERVGGVALLVGDADTRWEAFSLAGKQRISVGRVAGNDLVIPTPTVSARQAVLARQANGSWAIADTSSFNGTFVNGARISRPTPLRPGSRILFGNVEYLLMGEQLLSLTARSGVDVLGEQLVRYRKVKGKTRVTTDHVTLHIKRGEFVAIVGGSGSGKSTLLNELNGSEPADEGVVYVDGVSLYPNYKTMKSTIGYVPQQDIVYDNLTLVDMLQYAARLRMPSDMSKEERAERCEKVIEMLELENVRNNLIGNMSGGQKKRASIAVELLADPRLLFLDEPTSGLDPGIEQQLMETLARMAHDGRTIILVTHTTQNLHLCDQLVMLGAGGKLCYAGRPDAAPDFFGVDDLISIYNEVGKDPEGWQRRFAAHRSKQGAPHAPAGQGQVPRAKLPSFAQQFGTLSARYLKLILNDRSRLALLVLQAPFLAALISFVAGGDCFQICEPTKSCLFSLSCAAFWVGILDAIQEICKERAIFRREYGGGMRISAYVSSKVLVLTLLCLLQSALLTGTFCFMMGDRMPTDALISAPFELMVAMSLITLSAMCLGLFVSALFNNPDRAIAMAPLLIMPQILFSGLVFELKGVTENVSYFVNCRWGMEALGTTADLNDLDLKIYGEKLEIPSFEYTVPHIEVDTPYGVMEEDDYETTIDSMTGVIGKDGDKVDDGEVLVAYDHKQDEMFEHTMGHLFKSWGILLAFCVVCVLGCLGTLGMQMRAAQKVPKGAKR